MQAVLMLGTMGSGGGAASDNCHILNHAERDDGMFGMVTAFIVQ